VGGVYALMAVGLTLIFGVLDIINIAQGVLVILGAYLSYELAAKAHIDLFVGLLITIPAMFVIGVVIHWAFIRRCAARANVDDAARHLRGRADHRGHPLQGLRGRRRQLTASYVTSSVHVFGFYLSWIYLYGFALALALSRRSTPAVPDQVRPQRARDHAGRDGGPAGGHRREPRRRADLRHRRGRDRGRRHGVRRDQRLRPQQRLRPDLAAARDHHPGRPGQHRRRASRVHLHAHPGVAGDIWQPTWAIVVFYAALVLVLLIRPTGFLGRKAVRAQ
jgi:branched-chain amino acid transport system permease protein